LVNTDVSPFFLFIGMREFLQKLKEENFKLYVWTARPRSSTILSLKKLDLTHFFTDLYCFDDGAPKPSPEGLAKLTEPISPLDKKRILHIGDSFTDFEGAHSFGIEVIAACWNNPDQVIKYAEYADYTATNLQECHAIIKRKFHV
jgi:phosphoglycolate phosphatase